jgi:hypothetical protein
MTWTRERLGAGTAAFAWFLGLYALPFVHNLDHRDDHSHGPVEVAEDHHGHEEENPHPLPLDSDHGAGSLLHFAAAAVEAPALELPQVGPRISLPLPPCPRPAPSTPIRTVLVRGPPVVDLL